MQGPRLCRGRLVAFDREYGIAVQTGMEFEWTDAKRKDMETVSGLTFLAVANVFRDPRRLDWPDLRKDHGEERRKTIGMVENRCITVVYTTRADVVHIITAWPSSRRERKAYGET